MDSILSRVLLRRTHKQVRITLRDGHRSFPGRDLRTRFNED